MLTDHPRQPGQSFEGDIIPFDIDPRLTDKLKIFSNETGTTVFMILLAAYNLLLAKYVGQEDIIIGSGIAGRRHADLDQIIGLFVNMLAIRNQVSEDKTFMLFLREVRDSALEAYENQDYQFDELVMKLGLERSVGRNPLFDTQFTFLNLEQQANSEKKYELPGMEIKPYGFNIETLQFDLSLTGKETEDKLLMLLFYRTALFKRSTAEGMIKNYCEILEQVVENKDVKIKDINVSHGLLEADAGFRQDEYTGFGF